MKLRDNDMEEEATELMWRYQKDFGKSMLAGLGILAGTAVAAYFEEPKLVVSGIVSMTLWHNYGEMWQGLKIESDLEEEKYQVESE